MYLSIQKVNIQQYIGEKRIKQINKKKLKYKPILKRRYSTKDRRPSTCFRDHLLFSVELKKNDDPTSYGKAVTSEK